MFSFLRKWKLKPARLSADRARDARQWARAAILYREILRAEPRDAPLWVQFGHMLKEQGDFEAAEKAYRRSIDISDADADPYLHLGHLLRRSSRFGEARTCLEEAVRRSTVAPGRPPSGIEFESRVGLADTCRDLGDWAAAATEYERALAVDPARAPIWIQLGHALKESGRLADAEAAYRTALSFEPRSGDGLVQLGHVLRRQRRRTDAMRAYSKALDADPTSEDASQALLAAVGYAPEEYARCRRAAAAPDWNGEADRTAMSTFRSMNRSHDVVWFGNVEWHFRMQRPQHLARALSERGVRVVYVSMLFDTAAEPSFRVISRPHPRILEVRLGFEGGEEADLGQGLSPEESHRASLSLIRLQSALAFEAPVIVTEEPDWQAVIRRLPRRQLVYDCVDWLAGFEGVAASRLAAEHRLLQSADTVVVTSGPLSEQLSHRRPVIVRNGVDVEAFREPSVRKGRVGKVRLGYYGAVREWFAFDWIEYCARRHADWEFLIVGRVERPFPKNEGLQNIKLVGERPYRELADLLATFDVALIPFRVTALTAATNPVKLYEYMAGGKPVVATWLPEMTEAGDLVYPAVDEQTFEQAIVRALREDGPVQVARRIEWARKNSWANRAGEFLVTLG